MPQGASLRALGVLEGVEQSMCDVLGVNELPCSVARRFFLLAVARVQVHSPEAVDTSQANLPGLSAMSSKAELKIRALVLDFDSTISTPQYIERLQEWAVADKVQIFQALTTDEHIENLGGQKRIDALKALLLELSEAGVTLFIISIGYRVALMPQLETAGLLRFFADNRVYGQDSPELRQLGFVKGRLIERIMNHHGWGRDDVLFVDDSTEHIESASTVCKTLLVPPEAKKDIGGMRQVEFDAIRAHAFGEGPATTLTTAVIASR